MGAKNQMFKDRRDAEEKAQREAENQAISRAGHVVPVKTEPTQEEIKKQEEMKAARQKAVAENAKKQKMRDRERKKDNADKGKKGKGGTEDKNEIQITTTIVPFHEELERLRAIKGYLTGLLPKTREQQQPDPNAPPRRKKRKQRKPKGPCRHNLHWVNAFAEAECSKHLPHRREKVQESFDAICKLLEELEKKSAEKAQRIKDGVPEPEVPPTNGHDVAKDEEPAGGDAADKEDQPDKEAEAEPDKDAADDAEPKKEAPDDAAKVDQTAAEAPEEVAAT